MEPDRPTGRPNAHVGVASARMKGAADAMADTQYRPSPRAEATIVRYAEQEFHGGEPNADGTFTADGYKVDQGQRKRYYPAANAAEWYHDSARLWAMVDDLTRQDADPDLVAEIRRMARRSYEIAYLWQRGALSGLPEYAAWQEEGAS